MQSFMVEHVAMFFWFGFFEVIICGINVAVFNGVRDWSMNGWLAVLKHGENQTKMPLGAFGDSQ
jgi:hypothetical protein